MAGPLACVWLEWRKTRHGDAPAGRAGLALSRWTNWALAGGIALGAVLLAAHWFMRRDSYFAAVRSVPPSRLWFAGAELLFYFACMGAYVSLWNRWHNWRLAHRALAIAAATNLMIHFPALFAIISVASARPELLDQPLGPTGYRQMLVDGEVMSRVVHVWMAALAVTGAVVMGLALGQADEKHDRAAAQQLVRRGATLALVPTLLQVPSGFWLAMEMPEPARDPLLGGTPLATGLFVAALVVALVLVHRLAAIALGDDGPKQVRRSIATMLLLIMLMVATRYRSFGRAASLPAAPMPAAAEAACDLRAAQHRFQ
jgi:hypothetical protein